MAMKALNKPKSGMVAALDVGTTKVCCLIADSDPSGATSLSDSSDMPMGSIRVRGIGHQVSRGVKGGVIVDMEEAEASVLAAVHGAEKMAGETIRSVFVNLSGGYPVSQTVGVEVSVAGHEIGDTDLRRVLNQWRSLEGAEDRQLIHSIPVGFSIDGNRGINDPRGMFGQKLGANMHVVTADSSAIKNLSNVVQRCHLEIEGFVVSPFAAGLSSLVADEMDLGVTVVDMGGGVTTIAVFFGGKVIYTDCVPVGGTHVTNDIAVGLSTPVASAERLKTLYGSAIASQEDDNETIDVPLMGEEAHSEPNHVPKSFLVSIIQPRLEETFELVRSRLEASGFDKIAGRRVVLTGGASQLTGVCDLAQLVLNKQVRAGRPIRAQGLAEAAGGPAFATTAGLLAYASNPQLDAPRVDAPAKGESSGMFGRVGSWIREYF